MKRHIRGLIYALGALILMTVAGCVTPEPASISVNPSSINIVQGGGSVSVDINANAPWTLSNSASWLKTGITSGKGAAALVLTADANDTYESRTATISFTCGEMKAALTVTQPGLTPKVAVDVNMRTVPAKGGSFTVKATCPTGAVALEKAPEWITLESSASETFSFSAKANYTGRERVGELTFSSPGAESATVSVQQKGITPVFEITPSKISIGKAGGKVTVTVKANIGYHTEGVSEWITQKSSRSIGQDTYEHVYMIGENKTMEARAGVISFCNDAEMCIPLVVEQSAKDEDDQSEVFSHDFLHKSLFMRFTATWCGYCPMMASAIASAKEQLPGKIEQVCFHGGDSELESKYIPTSSLMKQYNLGGYPSGIVDGRTEIVNADVSYTAKAIVSAVKETESTYPVATGIAMSTSLSGGAVAVQGKVYVKAAGKYKLTVLLLEDNLDRPQADYIDGNHASYIHNDVARVALTDIKGEEFTIARDNSVYEFNLSGAVGTGYRKDNLRVLVYVQREFGSQPVKTTGNYGGYYVDNAASVAAGSSIEVQYAK